MKSTRSEYFRAYRAKNAERLKKFRQDKRLTNIDESRAKDREYYQRKKVIKLARAKQYYGKNREQCLAKNRAWRLRNGEKLLQQKREDYRRNPAPYGAVQREYARRWKQKDHLKNPGKYAALHKKWRKNNKEKANALDLKYITKRRRNDAAFRILCALRARLWDAIKRRQVVKNQTTLSFLGCGIETLCEHLESQFSPGMSWENYGQWHIDHIRPCASFDLSKESHQRQCFHWSNLQPLWGPDNIQKGAKLPTDRNTAI
jgi:hypothetical protein